DPLIAVSLMALTGRFHPARTVTPPLVTATAKVTLSVADTAILARKFLPAGSRKPAITPITVVLASSPMASDFGAPGVSASWSALIRSPPKAPCGFCSAKKSALSKAPALRSCTMVSVSGRSAPSGPGFIPATPCAKTVTTPGPEGAQAVSPRAMVPSRNSRRSIVRPPGFTFIRVTKIGPDFAQETVLCRFGDLAVAIGIKLPKPRRAAARHQGLQHADIFDIGLEHRRIKAVHHAAERG